MNHYRHILVPVDWVGGAWEITSHAARLAEAFGSRVTLLHAVDPPDPEAEQVARAELSTLRTAFAEGVSVEVLVVTGDPVGRVIEAAAALEADLVVMGTHARRGLKRLVLGSVAEAVLRRAPIPVLVVRDEEPDPSRRRRTG